MRITSNTIFEDASRNVSLSTDRYFRAQQALSTGKQLNQPSDDPVGASQALNMQSTLDSFAQYQRNLDNAKGFVGMTDSALSNVLSLVRQARTLVVQGASDTVSPDGRAGIATQIDGIVQSLGQIANTQYGNRYIFGGQRTTQAPFVASGGSYNYQGGTAATGDANINVEVAPGDSMVVNATGDTVFQDLFTSLQGIGTHLSTSNLQQLSGSDLDALDSAISSLTGIQADVGTKAQHIDQTSQRLTQMATDITGQLSKVVDADIPTSVMNLQSAQTAYQAALTAASRSFQQSLLDFLK